MIRRIALSVAVLALSSLSFAAGKTYSIVVSHPAKAGSVQLAPGEYKLKVDGNSAVFTDAHSSKSVTTPVKVETGEKKFNYTAVDTSKDGSAERIDSIELGGSTTKIEFSY